MLLLSRSPLATLFPKIFSSALCCIFSVAPGGLDSSPLCRSRAQSDTRLSLCVGGWELAGDQETSLDIDECEYVGWCLGYSCVSPRCDRRLHEALAMFLAEFPR